MKNNLVYEVAGHCFRLSFSDNNLEKDSLRNYTPFQSSVELDDCLFHLAVVDNISKSEAYIPIGQFDDDIASICVSKTEGGMFRFHIAHPQSDQYAIMDVDPVFRSAQVQLVGNDVYRFFCINNCLMLLYAFSSANHDTLMLHASVIKNGNSGYVFLGKSGTGKSTHSRLWLEHIEGSELLNDDNPVVRVINGETKVFGTPWSGKTPCYRNEEVLLKGIVKLQQAPVNKIEKMSILQSYASLLPSCSNMRWEDDIASGIHHTVEKVITTVASYRLCCLPDKGAAELCSNTVKNQL